MTGPEHYREAERLLNEAMSTPAVRPNADPINLAAAQVHATLALAAATAQASPDAHTERPLVLRPLPGEGIDPPYPGNEWGQAIYGEVAR